MHRQYFYKQYLWTCPLLPCCKLTPSAGGVLIRRELRAGAIWSSGPPLETKLFPHDKETLTLGTPTTCRQEMFRFTLEKCVRTDLVVVAQKVVSNWCNRTTLSYQEVPHEDKQGGRHPQLLLCKQLGFPAVLWDRPDLHVPLLPSPNYALVHWFTLLWSVV